VKKVDKTGYFEHLDGKFDEFMSDYDVNRRKNLIFSQLLPNFYWKNTKVLEVGCGTGRFSEEIMGYGGQLTVLDIGPKLVEKVVGRLGCEGKVGDACNLPFPDDSFDIVVSSECIEHTLDPEKAIAEMCRVCRTGGTICLTTPNKLWYPVLWLSIKLKLRQFDGIENWISPGRAKAVLQRQGLKATAISGCHLWPFQLKFTRSLLQKTDALGKWLYPLMINFGIAAQKPTKTQR